MKSKLLLSLIIISSLKLSSQVGKMGVGTISTTNVDVNTRTYLTNNANTGSTTLRVASSNLNGSVFSGNLVSGDLIMIIQMQGASINTSNNSSYGSVTNLNSSGLYEIRCVASVPNSTTINVSVPLTNSYSASGKTQIIRVPRYTNFTLNASASIFPAAWNGNSGGVTVIEVGNNALINGTINTTGRGFRGSPNDNVTQPPSSNITLFVSSIPEDGGRKGEGIAGSEIDYDAMGGRYGRGAPANGGGGGNSHNAGGGGGANAGNISSWNGLGNPNNTTRAWRDAWDLEGGTFSNNTSTGGGRGGYSYSHTDRNARTEGSGVSNWTGNSRRNIGGYGGRPLNYSTGRIFMGGGGGAGDGNNSAASGGANGGGIVFIICYGNISGSGTIVSNGATANNTNAGHNDAPGGGGGGGAIILSAVGSISNSLTLRANGGNGGNQLITNDEAEGPGGGGGGGYIAITSGTPTRTATGGTNGTTSSSALTEFIHNGATSGGAGIHNATFSAPNLIGSLISDAGSDDIFCAPVQLNANIPSVGSIGVWSIISGVGGSISNVNQHDATFTAGTSLSYTLVWTITNNLCQISRDTVVLTEFCTVLPVKIISFVCDNINNSNLLKWQVANEKELSNYTVTRSYDGIVFEDLDKVDALNHIEQTSEYSFKDFNSSNAKTTFYQLKIIHNNGDIEYSDVVSIDVVRTTSDIQSAFPNPSNQYVNLNTRLNLNAYSEIYISDMLGKKVLSFDNQIQQNHINLDISELQNGIYFINLKKKTGEIVKTKISKI